MVGDSLSAMKEKPPISVYIHIPFCPSKCGYCDFNSYAMEGEIVEECVDAICQEMRESSQQGRSAKTVFFGGGTPTFLQPIQLGRLLSTALETHPPTDDAEITSEANPGTVDSGKFRAMRESGFNRISIGAQSFQREDLLRLGRVHREADIGRAFFAAREAGFQNINLDLMFALPGQSLDAWGRNLDLALSLLPEHLSLYCLTIEPNTRFSKLFGRGWMTQPDEEIQVRQYDVAVQRTEESGYCHYEISNFAVPGRECRHNLSYWRSEEYVGYGPGAVGCTRTVDPNTGLEERVRRTNWRHPTHYVTALKEGTDTWCESESLNPETLLLEEVMMGIRLSEGIALNSVNPEAVDRLVKKGWIKQRGDAVSLTRIGRHYCNDVILALSR